MFPVVAAIFPPQYGVPKMNPHCFSTDYVNLPAKFVLSDMTVTHAMYYHTRT